MKYGILAAAVALLAVVGCSKAKPEPEQAALPVLYDTDMGNDVDDLLALEMLINYENEGRVELLGIGVSKANAKAYDFVSKYYGRYGSGKPAFGCLSEGPNPNDGNYLPTALAALGDSTVLPAGSESVEMYRRVLADAADSSITIIATGPLTNMARLLASGPDSISALGGRELVARKVRLLSVMGGEYVTGMPEWNIVQDTVSARAVFEQWPTALVASGHEVGKEILYPHESILGDFAEGHPLRAAYESYMPMPYDEQCWDLTSVLYAVEPDSAWFALSEPGDIRIDSLGVSVFTPSATGRDRYLKVSREGIDSVLINRVTNK